MNIEKSLSFFNRLFLVPKPNNKWSPILDLSSLNKYLKSEKFKMNTGGSRKKIQKKVIPIPRSREQLPDGGITCTSANKFSRKGQQPDISGFLQQTFFVPKPNNKWRPILDHHNATVIAYINKEGGVRSGPLCALLWQNLTWCPRNPDKLNVVADKLSRLGQIIQQIGLSFQRSSSWYVPGGINLK